MYKHIAGYLKQPLSFARNSSAGSLVLPPSTTPGSLSRKAVAGAIAVAQLLSVSPVGADTGAFTSGPQTKPYPEGGVLFGTPPDAELDAILAAETLELKSGIIAEYEVADGFVRFVDEGDSISTIVKGGRETFKAVGDAGTVGELFAIVAPERSEMPVEIARVSQQPLDNLVAEGGTAEGPTLEHEFEFGADDWAEGCSGDAVDLWESAFSSWHGFLFGDDAFSTTDHWDFGTGVVDDVWGYFGTLDEIWFGVCLVEGVVAAVEIERRYYDYCDVNGCGNWGPIAGTDALLGPGERYLYHNHSHYSPLRRGIVDSIGNANVTGWEYFISGAGMDEFDADDQFQAPN